MRSLDNTTYVIEFENKTNIFYGNLEVDRKAAGAYENTMTPTYGARTTFIYDKINTFVC